MELNVRALVAYATQSPGLTMLRNSSRSPGMFAASWRPLGSA
jgi:hypothetical protein